MCGRTQLRTLIACVLLPCYLLACTSWKTQEAAPEQVLAEGEYDEVQVTLDDGSKVVVDQPQVSDDTLTGLSDGSPVQIDLAEVTDIDVRGTDAAMTGLAIFGGLVVAAAAAFGIWYLATCTGDSDIC